MLVLSLVGTTVAAVTAAIFLWTRQKHKTHQQRDYNHPSLPLVLHLIAYILPTSIRRNLMLQASKPSPPLDRTELASNAASEAEVYETTEIVPDQLWRVRYKFGMDPAVVLDSWSFLGVDLNNDASLLFDNVPESLKAQVEASRDLIVKLQKECEGIKTSYEKRVHLLSKAGLEDSQDMFVVRVAGGKLLLYNPSRLHPSMIDWFQSKGTVEHVVSGSSSHTNHLVAAQKQAFPFAKFIMAKVAHEKCMVVDKTMRADFAYTEDAEYKALLKEFQNTAVTPFYIRGDNFTQTLVLIAHNHLLDVDLSCYGNGRCHLHADETEWTACSVEKGNDSQKGLHLAQLLYYTSIASARKVPGYLPDFRVMCMDPTSTFASCVVLDSPTVKSRAIMAGSLRQLLCQKKYNYVLNAHSKRKTAVPAGDWKKSVNHMWSWLDGKDLLDP